MISLLALATILGATPVDDPLAPHRGKPVVSIAIDAPSNENQDDLRSLIEIRPGYLLSSADIQTALKRLYGLGRFADVSVYAEAVRDAVILSFHLKPIARLRSLEVRTNPAIDEPAFLKALELPTGSEVDRRTPALITARAKRHLARDGYPNAEVWVRQTDGDDRSRSYEVIVNEGAPRRITALRFTGAPRVKDVVLRSMLLTQVGEILNEDTLDADRKRLEDAYLARGFLQVKVSPPVVDGDQRSAEVTFHVQAGPRVAVFFAGHRMVSERRLRTFLPPPNAPLHHKDVLDAAPRIEALYQRLGYLHARVDVQGYYDEAKDIVRYLVTVKEGAPVAVRSLTFTGNTVFTSELLRAQIRGVLRGELTDTGILQTLTADDRRLAAFETTRGSVKKVPPERRFLPELYERVLADIQTAYKNRGYLDATVGPLEVKLDGDDVDVTVPIYEGPQTHVRSVSFQGNQAFTSGELLAMLEEEAEKRDAAAIEASGALSIPNAPYSALGVEDARISIVRRYRDNGYLYMRLFSEVAMAQDPEDPERKFADVVFRFEEGPQVRVANVLIRGNRFTRDGLITSRMSLSPGDVYRLSEALRDQRSIAALGVFSSVRVKLIDEDQPAERKDVIAEVVERNRQAVEVQVGASTADGPRARFDYSHVNVFGTSSTLNLSLKVNRQMFFGLYGARADLMRERFERFDVREQFETEARAGIRSPRLYTLPLEPTARFDVVYERDNAIPYSLDAGRVIFGLDVAPSNRVSVTIEPQFGLTNLRCFAGTVGGTDSDCEGEVRNTNKSRRRIDEGLRALFKVGPTVTYDGRDDPFTPTRGIYATGKAVYAFGSTLGPEALKDDIPDTLSSDAWQPLSFTKVEGAVTFYTPAFWRTVLALSTRAGAVVSGDAPIDEHFYLGGSTTMRAFFQDTLWPDDLCVRAVNPRTKGRSNCHETVTYDNRGAFASVASGGNFFALFKAELRVPLLDKMSLGIFTDIGNLWSVMPTLSNAALRINGGVGLRYATPAGPIGLDVGFNPFPRAIKGERPVELQFAVGVF